MKTIYTTFSLFLLILAISSCSSTRNMRVQVLRPATITINKEVKSIALLNRSIPQSTASLESVITGERPAQDKDLSEECMRGINELLNTSERFKIVRCEGTMNAPDEKSIGFGVPLNWDIIDSLCAQYKVDAIMALEYFDTDFRVKNPGLTAANAIGHAANGTAATVEVRGTATANAGFRVYYPKTKAIVYEDRYEFMKHWTQRSANPVEAVSKLIKKNDALFDVSYNCGKAFAKDIVPLYFWENREMYKGKKGDLERGERQALAKDWEGAVKTWTEVYEMSNKSKIKAKAAFNIALGYEVLGKLTDAQIWIQRAYVEGGKQTALHYSDIIDFRIREQEKLKEQTEE